MSNPINPPPQASLKMAESVLAEVVREADDEIKDGLATVRRGMLKRDKATLALAAMGIQLESEK